MVRAVLVVVLLSGCGFRIGIGSDAAPDSDAGDGGTDGMDAPVDGPNDGPNDGPLQPTCILAWLNHTVAFQTPAELAALGSTSFDRDPFVSADELTIWFSSGNSNSQGGGDIFKATRTSRTQPFGAPARDEDFSTSGGAESKMSMTESRRYAVVASTAPGGSGGSDIWQVSRPNTTAAWGALSRSHTMQLATPASELDPFVTSDGMELYYAPMTPAPQRIVVAKRTNLGDAFASVGEVPNINTSAGEADPMLFASDRVIVFASARATQDGAGNLWYATRADKNLLFGTPLPIPGVNSGLDEADPHVSPDGCRIYFARNVGGGVDWQLFTAEQ